MFLQNPSMETGPPSEAMDFAARRVVQVVRQKNGHAQTPHLYTAELIVLDPPKCLETVIRPLVVSLELNIPPID